jgi:serine/threonine-protein kinase
VFAGRYEILDSIGAGGMGEVYRAIDKNLGRQVAIKILPAAFAEDKERMARFEREAKLLAVLNHPNIAAIHGLEESEGRRFLVLELAEGETLQSRLDRGPLPVDEAVETCRQLAEGLEAAHEKGIVHRDLKPGNIMITPEGKVKILDFGLAKAYGGETTNIDIEKSPTITAQMTEPGIILGTAAYMSPEQARSRPVDKRTDIWAFGCVLYECLTGNRAFAGETISEILAAILKGEPNWQALPVETSWRVNDLLRRCLQKDAGKRLHDIADARLELEVPPGFPAEAVQARQRPSLMWLAAGAAAILFAGIIIGRLLIGHTQSASLVPVVTATVKVETGYRLSSDYDPTRAALAISSDGRFVVYSAIEENPGPQAKPNLYMRSMDKSIAKPIAGTEGGNNPFLSPDNRWVGFWADGKLRKIPVEGGVPVTLCDASRLIGASWGRDNGIVFTDGLQGGLSMVSAEGGKPEALTKPDPKREESSHRLPSWLPNGKAVLFTVMRHYWDSQPRLALLRLDTREWHVLLQDAADARYVPTGHLVFLRQAVLMAVRFDPARMEVIGQPFPLIENVIQAVSSYGEFNTCAGQFGISDTGWLIYAAGGIDPVPNNTLMWVDQKGIEQPVTALQFPFVAPRLSPDGQRIAYVTEELARRLFVYDLGSGTNSPLTVEGRAVCPIWSPDGQRLLFGWHKSLMLNLYCQPYDGSSPMERLTTSDLPQWPESWSSDGKMVAFVEQRPDTGYDISILDVLSGRITPFLNSQYNEMYPEFSPDGRWIAYTSDESKHNEVYVRAFPGPGMKQLVSSEGGTEPLWARNNKQLFYRWGRTVWIVDVRTAGGFASAKPRLLFDKPGYGGSTPVRAYDLSPDGQRFLMVKNEERESVPVTEMILVQNWFEELKRLEPAGKK